MSVLLVASIFGIVGLYSQVENLGVVTTFFENLLFQTEWLFYFYQIVLFMITGLLVLAILLVLFKPISKKEIHLGKETGQINLPLHSLESIARTSLQEIVPVAETQVKIRLNKKQMAIVEVNVMGESEQFLSKGQQIQEKIPQALKKMAQLETSKTTVIFKKKKTEGTLLPTNKKESRVI